MKGAATDPIVIKEEIRSIVRNELKSMDSFSLVWFGKA